MKRSNLILPIIILLFFTNCNSNHQKIIVEQDFCALIHRDSSTTLSEQLLPFQNIMKDKTGVYVLEEGDISMISRAWLSEYAEKTIDVQYFIFSADNVGLIACDYLLRAAERGVKVRLLVDDLLIESDADALLTLDAHPNLSIKVYNPNANLGKNIAQRVGSLITDFRGFNQRMHNKTFTVDGKVVITGGRNIADEYFDYDHEYNFRDRDVLLIGGISKQVKNSFDDFWDSSLSVEIHKIVNPNNNHHTIQTRYNNLHNYACNPENFWPQIRENIKNIPKAFENIQNSGDLIWLDSIAFVTDNPGKNDGSKGLKGGGICTDALINLVKNATSSINIQSPYLITTELGQNLFSDAIKRGVKIKILTNSLASTDNLEAFNGYQRDRKLLLKLGIEIFEFKPNAEVRYKVMTGALQEKLNYTPVFGLHAKSMVIDEEIAVIGTFNLDPRSANLNTECATIMYSSKIAKNLHTIMEEETKPENAWKSTLKFNPDSAAGLLKRINAKTRIIVPKKIL